VTDFSTGLDETASTVAIIVATQVHGFFVAIIGVLSNVLNT
jgi:hypothetical protein